MGLGIDKVVNFLLLAGALQGFIFNLVTFLTKKKYSKVILYLNLTVLAISLNNLQAWIRYENIFIGSFFLKNLEIPWYIFVMPAFYSFLLHFLNVREKFVGYFKLAAIIFGIQVIIRTGIVWYSQSVLGEQKQVIETYMMVEDISNLLFSLFLYYKSWILVFRKQAEYKKMLSFDDIQWIKIFLILGLFLMLFWVFAHSMRYVLGSENIVYWPLNLASSFLLYWIGYQGLYRYNVVQDRIQLRRSIAQRGYGVEVDNKQAINLQDKHARKFEEIKLHIVGEQRFLDPDLTMKTLADELDISASHLSKLVNKYSSYNFSDFINSLRVEQSKQVLADPAFDRYTIVSIGLECGFNSKSTFYAAFKKFTSQTPTEYQEKAMASQSLLDKSIS